MQRTRALFRSTQCLRTSSVTNALRSYSSSVTELDEAAVASYEKNSQAFTRFPIESISFKVESNDGRRSAFPQLYVDGRSEFGLTHVVPFGKIVYAKFGPNGNLGRPRGYGPGTVEQPQDVDQAITLINRSLSGKGINSLLQNYFNWIQEIEHKLAEHIAANLDAYPSLKKKAENGDVKALLVKSVNNGKSTEEKPGNPDDKLFSLRQKLYLKGSPDRVANASPRTDLDRQALKDGLVRRHIPLYDANGHEIPVANSELKNFDVVSAQLTLNGIIYDASANVGFGLRKNIRSIVFLRSSAPPVRVKAPVTVESETPAATTA